MYDDQDSSPTDAPAETVQTSYETPRLVEIGDIVTLTNGGNNVGTADNFYYWN